MTEDDGRVVLSDEDGAVVTLEARYFERDAARKRGEEVDLSQDSLDELIELARRSRAPTSHPELRKLLDRPIDRIERGNSGLEYLR